MSQLEKFLTVRKMKHIYKNGPQVEKWDAVKKSLTVTENGSQLDQLVTIQNMGHS